MLEIYGKENYEAFLQKLKVESLSMTVIVFFAYFVFIFCSQMTFLDQSSIIITQDVLNVNIIPIPENPDCNSSSD